MSISEYHCKGAGHHQQFQELSRQLHLWDEAPVTPAPETGRKQPEFI